MAKPRRLYSRVAGMLVVAMAMSGIPALAQEKRPQTWTEIKCSRYTKAWADALARRGRNGIGDEFIRRHEMFLASGCLSDADVCPRSPEEFELANTLTILAMNGGTASTFLPFACRK